MEALLWVVILIVALIASHEHEMSKNFKKYGDAKALFFPIKR